MHFMQFNAIQVVHAHFIIRKKKKIQFLYFHLGLTYCVPALLCIYTIATRAWHEQQFHNILTSYHHFTVSKMCNIVDKYINTQMIMFK